MIYLKSFHFPDGDREFDFLLKEKRQCYDTFYPFKILSRHRFEQMDFEPVTIVYGGNGSGKSTALNIIAEKLSLSRDTILINPIFSRIISSSAARKSSGKFRQAAGSSPATTYSTIC